MLHAALKVCAGIRTIIEMTLKEADMSAWQPTHRHYKGGLYRVLFEATHSETEEAMTIYQTPDGRHWARPAAMFNETLPDGRKRFEPILGDKD